MLYDNGYINPRNGVGRRFNVLNKDLKIVASELTIMELCDFLNYKRENYRNINNYMRKSNGLFHYKTKHCYLYFSSIPLEEVLYRINLQQQINAV